MARTTQEAAAALGMKTRALTTYAKKYDLLPLETFGGQPMWEDEDIKFLQLHKAQMDDGRRCPTCGREKEEDAEVIATDEPDANV